MVKEGDKRPIILNIAEDVMELKISSQIGSMDELIDIELEGKNIKIGFNPKLLIDALRVIDDEKIDIYYMNPKAPCFIRDEEQSYIYLILPVNFIDNDWYKIIPYDLAGLCSSWRTASEELKNEDVRLKKAWKIHYNKEHITYK